MQTINTSVIGVNVAATTQEEVDAGVPPAVSLILHLALVLQAPEMPPVPIPYGSQTLQATKADALELAENITKAAEALPDPKPQIDIAGSIPEADVQRAAEFERKLKAGDLG